MDGGVVVSQDLTPHFHLLGPVEVVVAGRALQLGGRRQRALLALLLIEPGRVVSIDRLIDELWQGRPPAGAVKTLRSYVSRLRASVGREPLVARPPGYALDTSADHVDAERFERLLRQGQEALARGAAGLAADRLHAALALWRGPALGDVAETGLLALEAKRLDELRVVCLEQRIEADLGLGRHDQLVPELERLAEQEPLREAFRRQLVLALYRCGRQADAVAAYRRAREALIDLGLEPSVQLKELERAVLRQEVEAATRAEDRHNLPAPLTSFVGREQELRDVERLLRDHRLVTLTGLGGSGKTRLALEAAARQVGTWSHGVWLVDLTMLTEAAHVASSVARTLSIPERPNLSVADVLLEELRGSELLLVLDNCEHLVSACGELAELLLRNCGNLRVLATSRLPLPTADGFEYAVDPLSVPAEGMSARELAESPSVQLFLERAHAVRRDLGSANECLPVVGRICRELDGLPLAIELAAARAKALSLKEIAERLDDRFRFLRSWRRVADPRHQTLQATMDWSHDVLADEERALLRRLSIFAGSSTLEAVAAVCSERDNERALEALSRLLEASLVVAEETSGKTRYSLLETVRQYAAQRLDASGEEDDFRRRHAEFFARVAEEAEPHVERTDVVVALAQDEANFRAALSFSASAREPELMLRIAGALWRFWDTRNQFEEGRAWLEEAIRHGHEGSAPARARALRGLAAMVDSTGDHATARGLTEDALALYRRLQDDDGIARCLNNLGRMALDEDDLDRATALLEEALAMHQAVDEEVPLPPLANLADVATRRGDLVQARRLHEEVLAIARARQEQGIIAAVLTDLGWIAVLEGRHADAARLAGEALNVYLRVGAGRGVVDCVTLAGLVHASRGHPDDAARLVAAAAAELEHRGWPPPPDRTHRQPFEELERDLGEERYAAAWAEGAVLPFDDAVEVAVRVLT